MEPIQPNEPIKMRGPFIALGPQQDLRMETVVPRTNCVSGWRPAGPAGDEERIRALQGL